MSKRSSCPTIVLVTTLGGLTALACSVNEPPSEQPPPPPAAPVASPAPAASSAPKVEGLAGRATLEYQAGKKAAQKITALAEGKRLRLDVPAGITLAKAGEPGATRLLFDADHQRGVTVRDDQRKVTVFALAKLPEQLALGGTVDPSAKVPPEGAPRLEKTGKSDKVAGMPCDEWKVALPGGRKAEVCAAEEAAPWLALSSAALPPEIAWLHPLLDGHHVPVRLSTYAKGGVLESRLEVTDLKKIGIHPSDFRVPSEYELVDLTRSIPDRKAAPPGTRAY